MPKSKKIKVDYKLVFDAAAKGDIAILKQQLQAGDDTEVRDSDGNTPLIVAVLNGQKLAAGQLIVARANINAQNNQGCTALMYAAARDDMELAKLLLGNDAQTELRDKRGFDALTTAADNGHQEMVDLLIFMGMPVNVQTDSGKTPLILAAGKGHFGTVNFLLLTAKANPKLHDKKGNTPLAIAAGLGSNEIVKILLDNGAAVDVVDTGGIKPLRKAVMEGHVAVARMLLSKGADKESKIENKDYKNKAYTLLGLAALQGNLPMVQLLLEFGANINAKSGTEKLTAYEIACKFERVAVVKYLKQHLDNAQTEPTICSSPATASKENIPFFKPSPQSSLHAALEDVPRNEGP